MDRANKVEDLIGVLGDVNLRLASSEAGRDLAVGSVRLHDPLSAFDRVRGGVLLVPGLAAGDARARDLVERAAPLGFTALLFKAHGTDARGLADVADNLGVALILVHDAVDWSHIHTLIASLVVARRHSAAGSHMPPGDLFALANAIADAIGGATAIEDYSRRVLAYSDDSSQRIDDERQMGILGRQVPNFPGNDEQYLDVYRATGPIRFPPSREESLPRVAIAVRAGQEVLGSIWVIPPDRSESGVSEESFTGFAELAAVHLIQSRSAEDIVRQQRSDLTKRLLEGREGAESAMGSLGFGVDGPWAVVRFAPRDGGLSSTLDLTRLQDRVDVTFRARITHTGSSILDGAVYELVAGATSTDATLLTQLSAEVIRSIEKSLGSPLVAGVSRTAVELEDVTTARQQAERVTLFLGRHTGFPCVGTIDELHDELAVDELQTIVRTQPRLDSDVSQAMAAHDRAHDTEYRRLLLHYLDNHRDINQTAAQLVVHPNTVRYRLKQAQHLFHLQLDSPAQVLGLWLSLRAHLTSAARDGSR